MFFDRVKPQGRGSVKTSGERIYPAPRGGWVRNDNMVKPSPENAEVLRNWFPTLDGVRMRKGSDRKATLPSAVTHLATYVDGSNQTIFATTETDIYDVTSPADPLVAPAAAHGGLTSGEWSSVQFTPGSGTPTLVMVNGVDDMRQYNGTWSTITGTITGVATTDLVQVWQHKKRLWFIESATMSAWYLPVISITGAATEFPLGNIFKKGGTLLFGATWSVDAGDGMDDTIIFVTDQGEIAVYQGTDPGSDFELSGVYEIGVPLGKNATFRAGGDIAILTVDGIVSVAAAMQTDKSGSAAQAITMPIEPAWREAVQFRSGQGIPFSSTIWHSETMLVIGMPSTISGEKLCYVANSRTGKWCEYTGWDARCSTVFDDKFYFGTNDGLVMRGESGGSDDGVPYDAIVIPKFDTMKSADIKRATHAKAIYRSDQSFPLQLFANADYAVSLPTAISEPGGISDVWDEGVWGASVWSGSRRYKRTQQEWQTVAAVGSSLAVGAMITAGRVVAPDVELVSLTLIFEKGFAL